MNHSKIYADIINRAKYRSSITSYCEIHHIIPRCLGGGDEAENLVKLTAKEHFICHALLCHIFPQEDKLLYAFHLMKTVKTDDQERYISGSQYKVLRERYSKVVSEQMKGNTYTRGIPLSNEHRAKLSESQRAHNQTEEGKLTIEARTQHAKGNTYGSLISEASRQALSERMKTQKSRLGIPNKRYICEHCGTDTTSTGLKQYHGPNSTRSSSKCKSLAEARNTTW